MIEIIFRRLHSYLHSIGVLTQPESDKGMHNC
jgi:hypothetical protein